MPLFFLSYNISAKHATYKYLSRHLLNEVFYSDSAFETDPALRRNQKSCEADEGNGCTEKDSKDFSSACLIILPTKALTTLGSHWVPRPASRIYIAWSVEAALRQRDLKLWHRSYLHLQSHGRRTELRFFQAIWISQSIPSLVVIHNHQCTMRRIFIFQNQFRALPGMCTHNYYFC